MSSPSDTNDRKAQLDDVQRRIVEHPGYREKQLYDGLERNVYGVFLPNRDELVGLLDSAANDPELAVELFQNMWRPDIRIRFEGAVTRALHNYVASATSLVDHTRRIMRGRSGPIVEEFERRKHVVLSNPEVPFVHSLRNYVLHHSLPFIGHEVRIDPQPELVATGTIHLSARELKAWDGWSRPALKYIETQPDGIAMRPLIEVHATLVSELNLWLARQLSVANAAALAGVNDLIDQSNAILGGVDIDEAGRITAAVSRRRQQPRPDHFEPPMARGAAQGPTSTASRTGR